MLSLLKDADFFTFLENRLFFCPLIMLATLQTGYQNVVLFSTIMQATAQDFKNYHPWMAFTRGT